MGVVLSALLGLLTSAVPNLIDIWKLGKDNQHELDMLDKQIELSKMQADDNLQMTIEQGASAAYVAAHNDYQQELASNATLGNKWIVGLASSVRPFVTYAFTLAYIAVKFAMWHGMMHPTLPWQTALTPAQALISIWNEADMDLFGLILGFWFGSRGHEKIKGK